MLYKIQRVRVDFERVVNALVECFEIQHQFGCSFSIHLPTVDFAKLHGKLKGSVPSRVRGDDPVAVSGVCYVAWEFGVQELGRHRPVGGRSSAIQRYLFEGQALERVPSGAAVQLIARDAFVAETAIKLDQMGLEVKSLARELELIKGDIAELRHEASRSYRFSEFLDREHKTRAAKLEDLVRRFDYLKSRFDTIDGNSKGDYHAFQTFEAVSRRLTELGALEREFRDVSWKLKLSVGLFAVSLLVWLAVLTAG